MCMSRITAHMLAYAAMMTGQRDLAMKHIRAMVAEMPSRFSKEKRAASGSKRRDAAWK